MPMRPPPMTESDIIITRDPSKVDSYVITTDGTPSQSVAAMILGTLAEAVEARGADAVLTSLQALRDARADAGEAAVMDEANTVGREEYLRRTTPKTRDEAVRKILEVLCDSLNAGLNAGLVIAESDAALRDLYNNDADPGEVWECFTDGAYAPQPKS